MRYRLLIPADSERLKELYAKMGLAEIAHLPLPETDPCALGGIVGCNGDETAEVAALFRMTTEVVLVVNPDLPDQTHPIKGLIAPATCWLQQRDVDLRGLKLGGIDDVHAWVPKSKENMQGFMKVLDFTAGDETFAMFYRPIWRKGGE